MYAITLRQPWASLIVLGIKTVDTRSWPAPAGLLGATIAIHAARLVARQPGPEIEEAMLARVGADWRGTIPAGMVVATATLSGLARVERVNDAGDYAEHDPCTERGIAADQGKSRIDPWGDFSPGRWLWFLAEVEPLAQPMRATGRQGFWRWNDGMRDAGSL